MRFEGREGMALGFSIYVSSDLEPLYGSRRVTRRAFGVGNDLREEFVQGGRGGTVREVRYDYFPRFSLHHWRRTGR